MLHVAAASDQPKPPPGDASPDEARQPQRAASEPTFLDGRSVSPADRDVWNLHGARCHLVGIGGCGMSGLARMLRARGAAVTGTDNADSAVVQGLRREGVAVSLDQTGAALPNHADIVVASAAIGPDHPELVAARERGAETLTYAQALGRCMLGRTSVAVAGTHGKSTTSAMLGATLLAAGLEPTVIVGAACAQVSGETTAPVVSGFRLGADRIPRGRLAGSPGALVAEACEFNRSFHHLHPTIAAITSVEADHLDVYGTLDAVVRAFADFAARLPDADRGGRLLIEHDRAHRREITAGLRCDVRTIGFAPGADYVVSVERTAPAADRAAARQSVRVRTAAGDELAAFQLRQPGDHMAMNAAMAAVLADWLGAERDDINAGLAAFRGVERRMQPLADLPTSDMGFARLWDDYGHHPTEIDATLRALRRFEPTLADAPRPADAPRSVANPAAASPSASPPTGRLICVFQPHQHSRTRFLLDEFAQSFSAADLVVVPDIYFVRDSAIEKTKVSAADLVDRLRERGVDAMHLYPFQAIADQLRAIARNGDVIVTMGAGPVWKVAAMLIAPPTPPAPPASPPPPGAAQPH